MSQGPRHAVYWVPARTHPLWTAGSAWLGRDAESGAETTPAEAATSTPRRYGFHATLKAPMHLRAGVDATTWRDAVVRIAQSTASFDMPALHVATLGDFIALRPRCDPDPDHPLRRLADRCVLELDELRAPFAADDLAARREGLDAAAAARLERHGYQHVLDGWRFHMTLTDAFDVRARAHDAAKRAGAWFEVALSTPLRSGQIALFTEPGPDRPFVLTDRIALAG